MSDYKDLNTLIQAGSFEAVETIVGEMLRKGIAGPTIIDKGITPALDEVGKKFSIGECFIPEMLIAAKASQGALNLIKASMTDESGEKKEKIVIGTVQGDLHDIGKNIVAMTMEASGFEVKDLGTDVSAERFVEALEGDASVFLCLSCLLTTTMEAMRTVVKKVRRANFGGGVKILVGGPPTSQQFAKEIGADFRGENPYDAINQIKVWCGERI
jgi:methanogenic corrinoid protein MtbC1